MLITMGDRGSEPGAKQKTADQGSWITFRQYITSCLVDGVEMDMNLIDPATLKM